MSKHTPGPWKYTVDPNGENFHLFAKERADREERIIGGCGCCGSPWMGGDNHDANARLISAAPDLLAALVMVRDADNDCKLDELPTIPPAARAKIDAAIARAIGEQE